MDPTSPDVLEAVDRHTMLLLDTARGLDDPGSPSLCEGWTRGHVLTHVARNADGLAALIRSAVDGTGETMYASEEARDADIEAGADRSSAELLEDVEHSAAAAGRAPSASRPEPRRACGSSGPPGSSSSRPAGSPS